MNLKLRFSADSVNTRDYTLGKPVVMIGRMNDNDVVIKDELVSKRHARLVCGKGKCEIHDLDSRNGVFVNGRKIEGKAALEEGDTVRVGNTKFRIVSGTDEGDDTTRIIHSLGPDAEPGLDHQRLKTIYRITSELTGNQDVKSLGEKLFLLFREVFHQERGYLAVFGKDGDLQPLCCVAPGQSIPLSRSITSRIFQSGESLLLEDALSDESFKEEESILALQIRSALCVPLICHSRIYGLMYLDCNMPGAYKPDDLEFLKSIASIVAPLVENARLWSELKDRYDDTVRTLRETEASLIEAERTAAYVRLAHAMAHEIRNPLMVAGGLVRKLSRTEAKKDEMLAVIIQSVERMESVLREVDSFVKIPLPVKTLQRIDLLVQEELDRHKAELDNRGIHPEFFVVTSHVMVPLDGGLMKKAVSMALKELLFCVPSGKGFTLTIRDSGSDVEIDFGETESNRTMCRPFDPEVRDKPWSLGLFLNIAHKILSDHGGRILLDPAATSAYPIVMQIPR